MYKQQTVDQIDVYTDTDWAGCPKTRKSTSGGAVLLGQHTIKHWASTQASVALSSGEAEFGGVIRGAGQGLGYQALLADLGVDVPLRIWTDSSAAIGISSRQGLGKLRHLDTQTLWIQQAIRCKRIDLRKVLGTENPADLLTKHSITNDAMHKLVGLYDCRYLEGRAKSAPLVKQGASSKMTMADAKDELGAVDANDGPKGNGDVPNYWMPHNELEESELNRMFPGLVAPDEDHLADMQHDSDDTMLTHGNKLAAEIADDMVKYGRTRRQPKTTTQNDEINLIAHSPNNDQCNHGNRQLHDYNNNDDNNDRHNHDCPAGYNYGSSASRTGHDYTSSVSLSDNNQCRHNSFAFHDPKVFCQGYRSHGTFGADELVIKYKPLAGSAPEVHDLRRSLGLRGSVKRLGTEGTLMAADTETADAADTETGIPSVQISSPLHAGNVWLKLSSASPALPFCPLR